MANIRRIAGVEANLIHGETTDRVDVLPLLVATDGAIEAFARNGRVSDRTLLSEVEGLEERRWPGPPLADSETC